MTCANEHGPPAPRQRALRSLLRYDLPASLVVCLVAVPLSLGIALASGAPIAAGLIAAVIGGIVAGALGGSALQVSGPAAGLTVVLAETINEFGWPVTCAITVVAGALQIVLGASRIARAALAIAPAIVHAMLAGIGVTIVLSQLHIILGGSAQSSAIANVLELPAQIARHHDAATAIGLITIGLLILWPRLPALARKIPAPLAVIALVTVGSVLTGAAVARVELPGDLLAVDFAPRLPEGGWLDFGVAAVTIALIASVESLLCAVAVDKLRPGKPANLNRELIGQGAANLVSGAAGGLPVTGVIVRSSTNVDAGARSRASAILHGVWVLVFAVALAGVMGSIPLAALAGLLVYIGARLVNVRQLKEARRHGDLPLYLVTLLGVVTIDLLSGVLLGVALSVVLMLRRTIWSGVRAHGDGDRRRVVIEGWLTFLSVPRLSRVLAGIPTGAEVTVELIVDYLDHAAFDCLSAWQHAHERAGGTVTIDELGHPWFGRSKAGEPTLGSRAAAGATPRWLAPWSEWQAELNVPSQWAGPDGDHRRDGGDALRRGASEFQRRAAPLLRPALRRLANRHEPHTLFITCGDARVVPNLITTSGPGDLFTVRNIGNLVPVPDDPGDTSVGASVEFAVGVLGVREVVVCGHSGCGAMRALVDRPPSGYPALGHWLRHAEPSLTRHRDREPPRVRGGATLTEVDQLALHNVLQQLEHLRRYPIVAEAHARGVLRLTGMYFDVGTAQVHLLDPRTGTFIPADHEALELPKS